MGRPGGPGPLDPIFDVPIQYGAIAVGNSPGVTPLTVTINQSFFQPDPATVPPIVFDVVFSEAVTGFATGDVTLSGSVTGTLVGTVVNSGDDINFTVEVTGMEGGGIVTATIDAGVCTAIATGTPNLTSTSTDNTVSWLAPVLSDLYMWFDPSDASTLTLSGDEVVLLADKSGNGFDMDQHDGAAGPDSGVRSQNGLNVLDYPNPTPGSGVGTHFLSSVDPSLFPIPMERYTMFVVHAADVAPASNYSCVSVFGNTAEHGIRVEPGTEVVAYVTSGGGASVQGPPAAAGTWRLSVMQVDATDLGYREDGVAIGTTPLTGAPTNGVRFNLGCRTGGGRDLDGAIAEFLMYSPELSPADILVNETYLMTKWGI